MEFAMPWTQPRTLMDEVAYKPTAYVLYLNKLIGENDVINAQTLPKVDKDDAGCWWNAGRLAKIHRRRSRKVGTDHQSVRHQHVSRDDEGTRDDDKLQDGERIVPLTDSIAAASARAGVTFKVIPSAVSMLAAFLLASTAAQSAEDIFKGKTINIIVAAGEGGGFDIAARVTAQHLARFLPGRPAIVVQNMPGANGIRATEYIYRIAPRDGLTIGLLQPLMVLNKVLDPSARYEPQEFTWIGRMNPSPTFGVSWHTAPVRSIEQAKTTKLTLAAGGPLGPAWIIPQALNRFAGTRFAPIKGYPSATDQGLAMERGEVEGMGSASEEYLQDRGWFEQKLVNVIYTVGRERRPRAPDTPTVVELMGSERHRNVMKLLTSATEIGRAFVAPPGISQDFTATLRQGFTQMLQDPDFIADARRRSIEIEPLPPDQLARLVSEAMGMPEDVMEEARAAAK